MRRQRYLTRKRSIDNETELYRSGGCTCGAPGLRERAYTYGYAHAGAYTYTYGYAHAGAYTYTYGYADTGSYAYTYGYCA